MTREQIENMPAGYEIRKLLGTAMGWNQQGRWWIQNRVMYSVGSWKPDENILQALGLLDQFPEVYLEKSKGKFFCMIGDDFDNSAEAETAPLAICRAYLLYKMEAK